MRWSRPKLLLARGESAHSLGRRDKAQPQYSRRVTNIQLKAHFSFTRLAVYPLLVEVLRIGPLMEMAIWWHYLQFVFDRWRSLEKIPIATDLNK